MVTVGMLPPELLALLELHAETPASRIVVAVAASAIAGFLRNMGVLLVMVKVVVRGKRGD
jgi:hypothetical protein